MSDAIDRQAAKDAIKSQAAQYPKNSTGYGGGVHDGLWCAIAAIDSLPAAREERDARIARSLRTAHAHAGEIRLRRSDYDSVQRAVDILYILEAQISLLEVGDTISRSPLSPPAEPKDERPAKVKRDAYSQTECLHCGAWTNHDCTNHSTLLCSNCGREMAT